MMKKITRITLMTSMVAIMYTLPVFAASGDINSPTSAEDVNQIVTSISEELFQDEDAFRQTLIALRPSEENQEILNERANQFVGAMKEYCTNNKRIKDIYQETAKEKTNRDLILKKEIYENYKNLSKVNPEFEALAEKAYQEYVEAQNVLEWSKVLSDVLNAGEQNHINFEKQHNSMLKQEILAGDKHNNKDMSVKDFLVEYNQSH